jgi:hypothetical protein
MPASFSEIYPKIAPTINDRIITTTGLPIVGDKRSSVPDFNKAKAAIEAKP